MNAGSVEDLSEPLKEVLARSVSGFRQLISVERLSGGASQETYRLVLETQDGEQTLAMRRAPGGEEAEPRPDNYPGLAVEARLMQAAASVGVPEPRVVHVLAPGDGMGEGFIMQWLDGEALGARIARAPEFSGLREHLAYDCGRILAQIHAIDLDETGLRDDLQLTDPAEFVEQTWARYRDFPTPQPMIDYTARWLMDHLPNNPAPALVHNDFRNGNIMVDEQGVVAVLDWEIAHIGDPMRDLGWICTNSWRFGQAHLPVGGFGQRKDLFRGYTEVSGVEVDPERVKFWEVFGSFWWAVGSLGMAEHYRHGPDQTVERPAIGRRSSECQVDCANLIIPGAVSLIDDSLLNGGPASGTDTDGFEATSHQMPQLDELLKSVRDFLRDEVMVQTTGRTRFLARVAANSLDIVDREVRVGPQLEAQEANHLAALGYSMDNLAEQRWALVRALREGQQNLDDQALQAYLRFSCVNQLAIDQPRYSGLAVALSDTTSEGAI